MWSLGDVMLFWWETHTHVFWCVSGNPQLRACLLVWSQTNYFYGIRDSIPGCIYSSLRTKNQIKSCILKSLWSLCDRNRNIYSNAKLILMLKKDYLYSTRWHLRGTSSITVNLVATFLASAIVSWHWVRTTKKAFSGDTLRTIWLSSFNMLTVHFVTDINLLISYLFFVPLHWSDW